MIRPAVEKDFPAIIALYNHYIVSTPITFDIEPYTLDSRRAWFEQFSNTGRHRLIVTEEDDEVLGYAASMIFRHKAAYDPSVETSIYLLPKACGRGLGHRLYAALFDALAGEDIHRAYAGITLPNPASVALHKMLDFHLCGTFTQVGRKFDRYWDVTWYEKSLKNTSSSK